MTLNANTTDRCDDCGSMPAVIVKQGVQFGGKWIVWVLCVPCRLKEMAQCS